MVARHAPCSGLPQDAPLIPQPTVDSGRALASETAHGLAAWHTDAYLVQMADQVGGILVHPVGSRPPLMPIRRWMRQTETAIPA